MARQTDKAVRKSVSVKKDPIADFVVKLFLQFESFHKERFDKARDIYDMWSNKPPRRTETWQNQVNVPLMVEGEQTITPRLYTALFPTDAPLDVQVEGDAPEEDGIRIKSIIQHYFRVCDVQNYGLSMLTQASLYGTGYMEGGTWYTKRGYQHDSEGNRYPALLESRPDCNFIDFFEIFPHPAKRKIADALPIVRRRYIDQETLKKFKDSRFDADKLQQALESTAPGVSQSGEFNIEEKEYEILEYWGPYDEKISIEGKESVRQAVPHWIIVVNREVVIRSIPNPYNHQTCPYLRVKLFEDPVPSWFGVGIGQVGKPTQERINKIVNQRLDNVDLVLNKQGVYNGNDPLINKKQLGVSKPGKFHAVSDTATSIDFMDIPDVTASSYKEEELAKQDFRESTGATAQLMPEQGKEHRTAMGIQLLQGTAGVRFQPILRRMESDFIQALAMFFFSNLKQFMTEAQWIMVTGKNGEQKPIQISPEQIQAKVFFIPTGISETINKETQVGQLLRFKEITMQDPTVNRQEINKRIAELMGFKDIGKLLTPMKMPSQGGLGQEQQMGIQQMVNEGMGPDEIKERMLGPRPQEDPQEQQQPQMQGAPQ